VLRESEYGYLKKDMKALIELSPITHINKAKGPLLVLQGATDPRVPAGEAVQIYRAWKKKKLPVELILFEDEGHGIRKRNNRVTATAATIAFFKKHLR
jgi:dipeptidyl aminopeptidase/acylaminoacyl peptidase